MQTQPTTLTFPLADGDPGVALTIQKMSALIDAGKSSAIVHAQAQTILNQYRVPAYAWERQARAIWDWVRRNITFTPDPVGKEGVQDAEWTLKYRRGDCDCISVLMCSLLETIGTRCRLMTVAADPRDPEQFSHVYPQALVNGRWISVDVARRSPAFGLSPSRYFRKRAWSVHSNEYTDLSFYGAGVNMRGLGIMAPALPTRLRAAALAPPLNYSPPPAPKRFYRQRRRLSGLGQDASSSINWGAISSAIQTGTTGTANIITALRANPYNLVPNVGSGAQASLLSPYGYGAATPYVSSFGSSLTSMLPWLLLFGAGALILSRR